MYFNPIYGLNDLDVWKNVVVTYQKTGASTSTTSIYVDGELKQTDNHTLAMDYVRELIFLSVKIITEICFKGIWTTYVFTLEYLIAMKLLHYLMIQQIIFYQVSTVFILIKIHRTFFRMKQ